MKKRILLLEDDPEILNVLSYLLNEEGYEVKAYPDGENFKENIKNFSPDVILTDLFLAGLDGRSICRSIKLNPETSHIPVIMMSARPDLRPLPNEPGTPDDFISKPFDLKNVSDKIRKYL